MHKSYFESLCTPIHQLGVPLLFWVFVVRFIPRCHFREPPRPHDKHCPPNKESKAETYIAGCSHPSLLRDLRSLLSSGTPLQKDGVNRKLIVEREYEELVTTIYQIQHFTNAEGYNFTNTTAFGMSEGRLVFTGSLLVIGLRCLVSYPAGLLGGARGESVEGWGCAPSYPQMRGVAVGMCGSGGAKSGEGGCGRLCW